MVWGAGKIGFTGNFSGLEIFSTKGKGVGSTHNIWNGHWANKWPYFGFSQTELIYFDNNKMNQLINELSNFNEIK